LVLGRVVEQAIRYSRTPMSNKKNRSRAQTADGSLHGVTPRRRR
jgi:hypothetical protein